MVETSIASLSDTAKKMSDRPKPPRTEQAAPARRAEPTSTALLERSKLMLLGVVHDLNNLLTIFAMELETLAAEQTGEAGQTLERMSESAVDASHYIRELLDVEDAELRLTGDHDLRTLVESVLIVMRPFLGDRYEIDLLVEKNLPPARVVAIEIKQALMNLLFNSRKATPPGGAISIEIGRATRAQSGGQSRAKRGSQLFVAVRDDGIGMAQTPEPRRGIGLRLVDRIAEDNGGAFRLRRRARKGTEALLLLPAAEEESEP